MNTKETTKRSILRHTMYKGPQDLYKALKTTTMEQKELQKDGSRFIS